MKKLILIMALIVAFSGVAFAADQTLVDKTAATTVTDDDIMYIVDDPGGTPADRKVTRANLFKEDVDMLGSASVADDFSIGDKYVYVNSLSALETVIDSGGNAHLVAGTYAVSSPITLTANYARIRGDGDSTILELANGVNDDVIEISGSARFWQIESIQIKGNKSNNTAGHGINISAAHGGLDSRCEIKDVFIDQAADNGIHIADVDIREILFDNIIINSSANDGMQLDGSDHKLTNVVVGGCEKHGFDDRSPNTQYANCKAFGNGSDSDGVTNYYGFDITVSRIQLTGCQAQDNYTHGFNLNNDDIVMTGCLGESNNNGGTVAGTYAGIHLDTLADKCTIVGNKCFDKNATKYQDYGLIIEPGNDGHVITGNSFDDNLTGTISAATAELLDNTVVEMSGGDVNIADDTFVVDATNGRVGIGTSSPQEGLHYKGAKFRIEDDGTSNNASFSVSSAGTLIIDTVSTEVSVFDGTNNFTLNLYEGNNKDVVVSADGDSYLNGGGLAIGKTTVTSGYDVDVNGDVLVGNDLTVIGDVNVTGDLNFIDANGVNFNSDVTATGVVHAQIEDLSKSGNYTVTTAEAYGAIMYVDATCTITLPAIADGMSITVIADAAVTVTVDVNASDKIQLDGTWLDDGDTIDSTGSAGDIAVFTYRSADGWYAATNTWTDGGAT